MITDLATLEQLLAGIPKLDGAACKGHPELFDVARDDKPGIARAQQICDFCPARRPCGEWLDALPESERPSGVCAGRWLPVPRSARDGIHVRRPRPPRPLGPRSENSGQARCTKWLTAWLARHGGRAPVTDTLTAGAARGFSHRDLYEAKKQLGATSAPGRDGRQRDWEMP